MEIDVVIPQQGEYFAAKRWHILPPKVKYLTTKNGNILLQKGNFWLQQGKYFASKIDIFRHKKGNICRKKGLLQQLFSVQVHSSLLFKLNYW